MITGPEAGITRDSISLDWEWEGRAGPAGRYRGSEEARQGRGQARAPVGRGYQARARLCRGRGPPARRDARARIAGPQDREPGDRGGPRADHRGEQVGRRRPCVVAVQRDQGGARRGAGAAPRRAFAHRLGKDRQGHRHDPQGRVRASRCVEQAHSDRRAQSLVRGGDRGKPAACAARASESSSATSPR